MNIEYFKTTEYSRWLITQPKLLQKARKIATDTFTDGKFDKHPYIHFCDMVSFSLQPFGVRCQAAGMLHDVLYLAPTTSKSISDLSPDVWAIVDICTDKLRTLKTRYESRSGNFYQTFKESQGPEIKVEVAYRMCLVSYVYEQGWTRELQAYQREHNKVFKKTLYRSGVCDGYWEVMERCYTRGLMK